MKGFLNLGRGNDINIDVVNYIAVSNGRYFVKDIYGGSYEISKKTFDRAIKEFGKEILTKKENR